MLLRGFWGARQEDVDRLADKWSGFLQSISQNLDLPGDGWSGADYGEIDISSADAVSDWVDRSISESISADTPNLQFSITSDGLPAGASVSVAARMSYEGSVRNVLNAVVITVDYREPLVVVSLHLSRLLEALVSVWRPDWVEVSDRELRAMLADSRPASVRSPRAGYVTYLSAGRAQAITGLPSAVLSRHFDGGLILEFPTANWQSSRELALELDTRLARSSAMEELPIGFSVWS
jgi:hypothetical protein